MTNKPMFGSDGASLTAQESPYHITISYEEYLGLKEKARRLDEIADDEGIVTIIEELKEELDEAERQIEMYAVAAAATIGKYTSYSPNLAALLNAIKGNLKAAGKSNSDVICWHIAIVAIKSDDKRFKDDNTTFEYVNVVASEMMGLGENSEEVIEFTRSEFRNKFGEEWIYTPVDVLTKWWIEYSRQVVGGILGGDGVFHLVSKASTEYLSTVLADVIAYAASIAAIEAGISDNVKVNGKIPVSALAYHFKRMREAMPKLDYTRLNNVKNMDNLI